ncbi:MAG: hypothetical protein KC493_05675 [Bacteriovoracaceae bacterium]|nr:hypothetical protein [Bacteriovoracaceae bacterium]
MNKIKILSLVLFAIPALSYGFGTGVSTYPIMLDKKFISGEFTGVTSNGGGVGVQGRYTQRLNNKVVVDGGIGMAGGQRTSKVFAGADFELYPDYQRQPRVSLKTTLMNSKEFTVRRNSIGFSPTVSKGFSFWGHEAYPFVALPYKVSLDSDSKTYETQANINMGITGNLPFNGYRHLTGTLEASVKLKDSYTGFFMGISYPIN